MSNWSVNRNSKGHGDQYRPVGEVIQILPPDVYDMGADSRGIFFYPAGFDPGDVIRFQDATTDAVVADIEEFWRSHSRFEKFEFPYKRGIMLHGPAGTGKTSALKLIIQDIVKRGGVAFRFFDVNIFIAGMKAFREIQPSTPVVVIMEDLDQLLQNNNLSLMLNVLDGVAGFENIVYLATTNYPEQLQWRISNRPNRFDRRFEIGYPSETAREQYLAYLLSKDQVVRSSVTPEIMKRWVADTAGMTFAHIRDLVLSVFVCRQEYDEAIGHLRSMYKHLSSTLYEREAEKLRTKKIVRRANKPTKKKTKVKAKTTNGKAANGKVANGKTQSEAAS
jgi:SpoVK/Ycf46/Vps4 family AAA+-type ATPase